VGEERYLRGGSAIVVIREMDTGAVVAIPPDRLIWIEITTMIIQFNKVVAGEAIAVPTP
jgi:hypothetical protein